MYCSLLINIYIHKNCYNFKFGLQMQFWAESKQETGAFTGSTGVKVLSSSELNLGVQAWAKRVSFKMILNSFNYSVKNSLYSYFLV